MNVPFETSGRAGSIEAIRVSLPETDLVRRGGSDDDGK